MSVEDIVELTHEIPFKNYIELYKYFAGDIVITNEEDVENKEDDTNILDDRWGGYVEQVALSHTFALPVVVLIPQRYDPKKNKIYNGIINRNKAYKGVRYRISQIVGQEYLTSDNLPVYLVWKKTANGPHYLVAYPTDYSSVNKYIT
jgi:hypothetical protein